MTSSIANTRQIKSEWIVIDASDAVPGRLASFVAKRLRGKHRVDYTPHVDTGDYVIIVNADKIRLTGRKTKQKTYYRHTGFPGGIKATRAEEILNGRHPERLLKMAIRRMLPKESSLARQQFAKLRVYAGKEHPHHAQKPQILDFVSLNSKNTSRE